MGPDEFMELEFNGKYFYLKTVAKKTKEQYPITTTKWYVMDETGELVVKLRADYEEYRATNPLFIEEMIDTLMKVVRKRIFLYERGIPDVKGLDPKSYKEFVKYVNE